MALEDDRTDRLHEVGRDLLATHDPQQAEDALAKIIFLDFLANAGFAHRAHAKKLARQIMERLLAEE